jgi:3-hydroxyethyl bacteriochlorophyllide a dehydrogenase
MKARAVVFPEAGRVELREVTLREPQPDEVVVDTMYSSISSGTERLLFFGQLPAIPHLRYPLVPGYEAVGIVASTGAQVEGISPGDRVFVGGSFCYSDVAAAFGGQSSRLIKKASQIVPLENIPLAHAPLLALAATARHGVARLGDVSGARVAVFGAGAVGQLAAGFLAIAGAHPVLIDRSAERLQRATAGETVDVSNIPLEEQQIAPVRHSIEATGDSKQISSCARITEAGGSIVLLSYYDTLATPFVDLFLKESTLLVSREWAPADLLAARDAVSSGDLDLGWLASHVVPIDRYADAYDRAFNDSSILKVVLQWA